jgi:hypothetical protein
MVLKIYNNLGIRPRPGERFANIPMQTRANPIFHENLWYSNLAIQFQGAKEEESTGYGQSCLFFKSQFFYTITYELVFIHMNKGVPSNSLTKLTECNELRLIPKGP